MNQKFSWSTAAGMILTCRLTWPFISGLNRCRARVCVCVWFVYICVHVYVVICVCVAVYLCSHKEEYCIRWSSNEYLRASSVVKCSWSVFRLRRRVLHLVRTSCLASLCLLHNVIIRILLRNSNNSLHVMSYRAAFTSQWYSAVVEILRQYS